MPTPRLNEAKRQRILALRGEGLSMRAIAKNVGVGYGTVSNVCSGHIIDTDVLLRREKDRAKDYKDRYYEALKVIDTLRRELDLQSVVGNSVKDFRAVNIKPKRGGKGEATAVTSFWLDFKN